MLPINAQKNAKRREELGWEHTGSRAGLKEESKITLL